MERITTGIVSPKQALEVLTSITETLGPPTENETRESSAVKGEMAHNELQGKLDGMKEEEITILLMSFMTLAGIMDGLMPRVAEHLESNYGKFAIRDVWGEE
jgi:hypothetical protein